MNLPTEGAKGAKNNMGAVISLIKVTFLSSMMLKYGKNKIFLQYFLHERPSEFSPFTISLILNFNFFFTS